MWHLRQIFFHYWRIKGFRKLSVSNILIPTVSIGNFAKVVWATYSENLKKKFHSFIICFLKLEPLHLNIFFKYNFLKIHIPTNRLNSWKEILPSLSVSAAASISSISGFGTFTGKLDKTNSSSSVLTNPSDSGSNLKFNLKI